MSLDDFQRKRLHRLTHPSVAGSPTSPLKCAARLSKKADLARITCHSTKLETINLPCCLVSNLQPRRRLRVNPW